MSILTRALTDADVFDAATRYGWRLSPAEPPYRMWVGRVAGKRVGFIDVDPSGIADPAVRVQVYARQISLISGGCPHCNAAVPIPAAPMLREGEIPPDVEVTVEHDSDCPIHASRAPDRRQPRPVVTTRRPGSKRAKRRR